MKFSQWIFTLTLITQCMPLLLAERIPVLIVDGQNNHDWVSTTDSLQATLEATKRFTVKIETAQQTKSIKEFVIRDPVHQATSRKLINPSVKLINNRKTKIKHWMRERGKTGILSLVNTKRSCLITMAANGLKRQKNLRLNLSAKAVDWSWSMRQIMHSETGMRSMK